MRVFVTGATGYIGSAVVRTLVQGGHEVTGLSRSDAGDARLRALGAEPVRGTLTDAGLLESRAAESEAVVHAGMASQGDVPRVDRGAVDALLAGARKGNRPRSLVYTSGVWVLGDTGGRTEDESGTTDRPAALVAWRPAHEKAVLDAATESLATTVLRPGIVYGGARGIFAGFFASASKEGAARYFGDGKNHWANVHRDDLAVLYRLLVEKRARGVFHGVDGVPVPVAEIARLVSDAAGKNGATHAVPASEAPPAMRLYVEALCLDQRVVAKRSREIGWAPAHASFAASVDGAFAEWKRGT